MGKPSVILGEQLAYKGQQTCLRIFWGRNELLMLFSFKSLDSGL